MRDPKGDRGHPRRALGALVLLVFAALPLLRSPSPSAAAGAPPSAIRSAPVPATRTEAADGPTLLVLLTVDQLRPDLLERFRPALTGGLARLLEEGRVWTQASHAHAVTATAPGHATLATGVFPARSGIVANEWWQREAPSGGPGPAGGTGRGVGRDGEVWTLTYAVADPDAPILGADPELRLPGRSPRNLLRPGLADWVRAHDARARSVSISSKDRAAVTTGGYRGGEVYWIPPALGRVATSTYYRSEYPAWVERFNAEVMPGIMARAVWESVVPAEHRALAEPDEAAHEGDGTHTTFPHRREDELRRGTLLEQNTWVLERPFEDEAALAFAHLALEELALGQRGVVDFLSLSLSATDHVGHHYGPHSQEQLSNLIHLDRGLGTLFEELDRRLGPGGWIVGFSADHGVADPPELARSRGNLGATRVREAEERARMETLLDEARSEPGAAAEPVGAGAALAERLAALLEGRGFAVEAYTHRELTRGEAPDSFAILYRNSHYPGRGHGLLSRYGVEYRAGAGDIVRGGTGTTHGSPYWYDRHVPFILMGAGVSPGTSPAPVHTVDMAPTLAALAGIPFPTDLDGNAVLP